MSRGSGSTHDLGGGNYALKVVDPDGTPVGAATEAFAFEEVTVSTVAVGFTPATYDDAVLASCQVTGGAIRVRYDGGDPTTDTGIRITDGQSFVVAGAANIANFKMVRDDETDAEVAATFEREGG